MCFRVMCSVPVFVPCIVISQRHGHCVAATVHSICKPTYLAADLPESIIKDYFACSQHLDVHSRHWQARCHWLECLSCVHCNGKVWHLGGSQIHCSAVCLCSQQWTRVAVYTGVLQKLSSVQALDVHDIEGVYPLYQHVLQQLRQQTSKPLMPCHLQRQVPDVHLSSESAPTDYSSQEAYVQSMLDKSWPEQISIIREYLLAATAKDCSLMVTMQATQRPDMQSCRVSNNSCDQCQEAIGDTTLQSTTRVMYQVAIVDLDVKPHAKIATHYCLDCQIMKQLHSHLK